MSDDSARIEISASSSQLDAGLRDAAAKVARWSLGVSASVARGVGGVGKMAAPMLTGAAHRVGAAATDFVVDQARGVKDFESDLVRLGIAGDLNRVQLDKLRESAMRTSTDFGIGKDQILKGAQAYVDLTGDIAGAGNSMEMFGKVSAASGASVDDVAKASAALRGVGVDLKNMPNTFSGLIAQGKQGAVSLKDFAGELAGILPRWAKFNEGASDMGLAQMGAVFQVARQGFGSASEAATGMQALMGALTQNAEKFRQAGVQIFDKDPKTGVKNLRTFEQIMASIEKSKLVKDPTLMTKALGSKEAEQTVTMLLKARQATEGHESAYRKLIAAGGDYGVLQKDLDTWMSSGPGKWEKMWEGLKNRIAEAFTPERIEAFLEIVSRLAEGISKVIDLVGEAKDQLDGTSRKKLNPFEANWKTTEASTSGVIVGVLTGGGAAATNIDRIDQANRHNQAGDAPLYEANRSSFDSEMAKIEGMKSRSDKIRAAVAAEVGDLYGGGDPNAPGAQGRKLAGKQWLEAEGINKDTVDRERAKMWEDVQKKQSDATVAAFKQVGADLVNAINNKSIAVDGNKVDDAISKSTNPRRSY